MTIRFAFRSITTCLVVAALTSVANAAETASSTTSPMPSSPAGVFDEARFEVSASLGAKSDFESGVFLTPSLFFDPFESRGRTGFDKVFHPRLFVAANVSMASEASQLMGGLSWRFPTIGPAFVDLGFGGALTNASLDDDGSRGPGVGSHLLFHEYLTLGVDLDKSWSLTATVRHSSNANLAPPNNGLTYGGIGIGKRF